MIIREQDLELYHHGVIGMKWGVKRVKDYHDSSRIYKAESRYYKNKANTTDSQRKSKKYNKLSNESLKESKRLNQIKKKKLDKLINKYGKVKIKNLMKKYNWNEKVDPVEFLGDSFRSQGQKREK